MSISLALAGVFVFGFGVTTKIVIVVTFGFLFFAMLPLANNCLDYLARTNIPADAQGRAWGLIGFLSQMGYVIAYSVSGVAADALGVVTGGGVGKGAALVIQISGVLLALIAGCIMTMKSIRALEASAS